MPVVVNNYLANLTSRVLLSLQGNPGSWTIHLFVNLYSPTPNDSVSVYKECTLAGYSPFALVPAEWTGGIGVGNIAVYTYPQLTWVFNAYTAAQQTVFGYWVQDASGNVLYGELFPAPFPVPPAGGELPFIPTFSSEQCPATV